MMNKLNLVSLAFMCYVFQVLVPCSTAEEGLGSEGRLGDYMQLSGHVGYNFSWNMTAEAALILGKRNQHNIIWGPAPSIAYTDAGTKYGFGVGLGFLEYGGGLGSLRLQYVQIEADNSVGDLDSGNNYDGIEILGGIVGPGGGYGFSLGFLKNKDDSDEDMISIGIGIGF